MLWTCIILMGRSTEVEGFYRRSWPGRGEDSFSAIVRGTDGSLGTLLGSYLASTPRMTWEICGEEATLRYDYKTLDLIRADGTTETIDTQPGSNRFLTQCNAWLASMDGATTDLATADDGYFVATAIDTLTKNNADIAEGIVSV